MLWLRIAAGFALAYAFVLLAAWAFQERLAFPAPRAPVPDPKDVGIPEGERLELTTRGGTRLAGWYLPPKTEGNRSPDPSRAAGLLWFYGNGENIASLWSILRDFQPPGAALLVVDYPGYGGSEGRTTEPGILEAAEAAYEALARRPEVARDRIFVYGRSLGTVPASHLAATRPVAGLILESPFTNAREMSARHYGLLPRFVLRLRLDNLSNVARARCPVLVVHGTADRLVPPAMGRRVAAAAGGPVELALIEGAGHNETYEVGGRAYRDKLWEFVRRAP
ncbi:MAG TPA: alpha/beta hydrolase [Gemmatimonadales bacterium]|nr:alpha/beta hydrolase [Gemmatimonadales bacterium]